MNAPPTRASGLRSVVVTGIGATTPVGAQVVQTITSIRAGIARLTHFEAFEPPVRDPSKHFPEPLIAGRVAGLPNDLPCGQRLLAMATPALAWALDDAAQPGPADFGRVDLLLFGGEAPATRCGTLIADTLGPRLAHRLTSRMGGMPPRRTDYADTGAAGFLRGLASAAAALTSGICDTVVLGAVDSLLAPETLLGLADSFRLKTAENPVGLIPAEAAAFVVLELDARARKRGARPYARLGGMASSVEPDPAGNERGCDGKALAACLADVLGQMQASQMRPTAICCNLNGEPRPFEEWGCAAQRLQANGLPLPSRLVHPADCMGDAGAAMAGVLTCLSAHSLRHARTGWAPTLLWCGAESGLRTAAYLEPFQAGTS